MIRIPYTSDPDCLVGWKGIAAATGIPERTLRRWATLDEDPLPVGHVPLNYLRHYFGDESIAAEWLYRIASRENPRNCTAVASRADVLRWLYAFEKIPRIPDPGEVPDRSCRTCPRPSRPRRR